MGTYLGSGMSRIRRRRALLALGCLALGCGRRDSAERELLVFAAASLTDAFTEIARAFEGEHAGVTVKLSFGGSQALRMQIENGAEPQVYASANHDHVQALQDQGRVRPPVSFTRNRLVVVVPEDNPTRIERFADLPRAERLVLCDENVPAGAYTRQSLARAAKELGPDFARRVEAKVVSRESNVRQTLQKVVLGEADAAVVYASDAVAGGEAVTTIDIPDAYDITATYSVAILQEVERLELAKAFVATLRSEAGQAILSRHGFSAP